MAEPIPSSAEIVIIGGGVIGLSIAYYLAKKGASDVLLLEKGYLGEGSTAKCAGGIRRQFSSRINTRFSEISYEVFQGFYEEFGMNPDFHADGYLFLASTSKQWDILESICNRHPGTGDPIILMDPDEISSKWPFIRVDDLKGGSFSAFDGYLGPYEVVQGYARAARRLGVTLRENSEVSRIHVQNGRIRALELSDGHRISASIVINAAGPYAAGIAAMAGLELPVFPLRRQLFFTDTFDALPQQIPLMIDMKQSWYMRREGAGLLLAGPQDREHSFSETTDFNGREWAAACGLHRVPSLSRANIMRGWAGLYAISPDLHAVIGSFPELRGLVFANGFSGHGFQHSPAVGMAVAELVMDGETKMIDIEPLSPTRFREGKRIGESLAAFEHRGIDTED